MLVGSCLRVLRNAIARIITSSGSQEFLGARWLPLLLQRVPRSKRRAVALWLLSLSPHYFYDRDREFESRRNRDSRAQLVEDLLAPRLDPETMVLDYGCGPGYMATAVASRVRSVEAVDISRGVLACARVLNDAANVVYETLDECAARQEKVDLVYSFAVIQHLTDEIAASGLRILRRRMRDGGTLLLHFSEAGSMASDRERQLDRSLRGRLRLRFALNVFGRGPEKMRDMAAAAGFVDITFETLSDMTGSTDDVAKDRWLVARADDAPLSTRLD